WVVYFRNTGSSDTLIIENILAADMPIAVPTGDVVLHHSHGSTSTQNDFLPIDDPLAPNAEISLAPIEGRSSDGTLPFFNLEWPGGGVVCAVGWTGQWSSRISRDAGTTLKIQAGQQTTHLKLHPGEMIRTPRMLMVAWQGNDPIQGCNQLRQLLIKHYLPRLNGKLIMPPITQNTWFTYVYGSKVDEQNQMEMMDVASQAGVECYWLDAGWFQDFQPGSWVPRTDAFPRGLRPLGDAAHKKGMKFVLWFEPERVHNNTIIGREHSEWEMKAREEDWNKTFLPFNEHHLFDLGDQKARRWLTDMLLKCIEEWGVDIYRQDFNLPGSTYFWLADDAPDRQGISENMHIQGLYIMWDELRERHPGLWIDNCASGGRRIDLETITRSLPLWRSDTQCAGKSLPTWDQVQTAGLSLYVPLHSASVWSFNPYEWRSVATSGTNLCMDHRAPGFDMKGAKRAIKEAKELRQFWTGDYYPLVDISLDNDKWCAWQFDRSDLGAGFAMYFRRPKCPYIAMASGLHGIDPKAKYEVILVDSKKKQIMTGKELCKMPIMIEKAPASVLLKYRKMADK
ncbi:MAG: glycoside hydrolase family 36 protein, partial [Armatimonadota bacterium]